MEAKLREDIDNTFDDEKFAKMSTSGAMKGDVGIDAAYARKEFGDKKPELVDYMLWMIKFVSKSEYVDF